MIDEPAPPANPSGAAAKGKERKGKERRGTERSFPKDCWVGGSKEVGIGRRTKKVTTSRSSSEIVYRGLCSVCG